MKKIHVHFQQEKALEDIDIVIRADKRDTQIDELIERLINSGSEKFTVLDQNNCPTVIDAKDIVLISADGKSIRFITVHSAFHAKQSLQSVEDSLGRHFLRVSRFDIINLKMVRKYDFTLVGTLRIEFENGMETWASRRYIPLIKEKLSQEEGYLC